MPRAHAMPSRMANDRVQQLPADEPTWRLADGILFSVLSSLVLWSALLTSVYKALG